MFYIRRDDNDKIVSISKNNDNNHQEELKQDDPELVAFLKNQSDDKSQTGFVQSDMQMVRVLEDLIDLLISKHIIAFTELPIAAQEKILDRQNLREKLSGLISDEDDTIDI